MSSALNDHCYNQPQQTYKYPCSKCNKRFQTESGLKSHKKRHSSLKKHICKECGKCFHTRTDVLCHSVVNHGLRTRYCCKLCDTYWICEDMYVQHMRTHGGETRMYKCSPCDKSFKTLERFHVHHALHFEKKLQGGCGVCYKSFMHSRILREHRCDQLVSIIKVEDDDTVIKVEDDALTSRSVDNSADSKTRSFIRPRHKRRKRSMRCKQCKRTFVSEHVLNCHLNWSKWEDQTSKLTCMICDREFDYQCKLKKHKESTLCRHYTGCLKCGEVFKAGFAYEQHVKYSSSCGDEPDLSVCSVCGLTCEHCKCSSGYTYTKTCKKCEKTFSRKSAYIRHINYSKLCGNQIMIANTKKFACDLCGRKFGAQMTLDAHKARMCRPRGCRGKPQEKRTYTCPVCNKDFRVQSAVDKHMITHTKEKNFECAKCNMKFLYNDYRINHYRENPECGEGQEFPKLPYDPKKLVCEHCGEIGFRNRSTLNRHIRSHTPKDMVCQKCGLQCFSVDGFRRHVKNTCLGDRVCTVCNKKGFKGKRDFFTHMLQHDAKFTRSLEPRDGELTCRKCGKSALKPWELNNHVRHICGHGLCCEHCGETNFRSKIAFRKHMFKHNPNHNIDDEPDPPVATDNTNAAPQELMCPTCYKTFNTVAVKIKHVEYEHWNSEEAASSGAFLCDLCPLAFTARSTFRKHRAGVHGDKVPCKECGKAVSARSMALHVRTHTGETPYSCAICGKAFKTRSNLNYHRNKQTCKGFNDAVYSMKSESIN